MRLPVMFDPQTAEMLSFEIGLCFSPPAHFFICHALHSPHISIDQVDQAAEEASFRSMGGLGGLYWKKVTKLCMRKEGILESGV